MSFLGEMGGMPYKKILKFRCLEMQFSTFSRQYLGFKNNQNYDYINHIPWLLELFFSSKSQSLAFRKERNDKSSDADSKNCIQCFNSLLFFKKKHAQQ